MTHLNITSSGLEYIKNEEPKVYYNTVRQFPALPVIGDFLIVKNGDIINESHLFNGAAWTNLYNYLSQLEGKKLYCFGDSLTLNVNNTLSWSDIITTSLKMVRIKKIGTTDIARSGTTLMKRAPINIISAANMVDWSTPAYLPQFSEATDGLIFISYLTNDVGLNLPNYTIDNYEADLRTIIQNCFAKGWAANRLKFNLRYWLIAQGLDYTTVSGAGVTVAATMDRYNAFASRAVTVLTEFGIQYFDHFDLLAAVPNPETMLDSYKRHLNNVGNQIVADNIISNLSI